MTLVEHCDLLKHKFVVVDKDSEHVNWMLTEIPNMDNISKLNRWLGFVHGWLWTKGFATIEELRILTKATETNETRYTKTEKAVHVQTHQNR